ncbi:MAG TPA: M56 family metallopeptidase [Vicinamibacteria bacterium]|nr:M56 family metallopeptidase [Vicinamibacteria bacterium]
MEPALRWLLTYLVHSTLLLGAAGVARLALRERRLALQEAVLRAALVGGFVTASLQVGLDLRPLGGALRVPTAGPAVAAATASPALVPGEPGGWQGRPVVDSAWPAWAEWAVVGASGRWRSVLALGWIALTAVALARLLVASVRLRRLLRGRRPLDAGELAPGAAALGPALGLRRPVRLSSAPRLRAPLAKGVLRPEVCLPARVVAELAAEEQVALCAHELAHLARRDPAWILTARLVEAAVPLQPLNAWARRRLQDLAECLSDDLAVAASGRPLGLARSLVDVASWTLGERPLLPAAALGALSARSRLGHRVERLMDPFRALERPRRLLLPAAAIAVLATALVTPVVSGSASPQEPPPAPAALPAPRAEPAPPVRPVSQAPPVPSAQPVPQAQPEPKAAPAPRTESAPGAEPAPKAPPAEVEAQIEALSRRIEERARMHDPEMKKLEAEIEALASRIKPNEAEMERLSREVERAAAAFAESAAVDLGAVPPKKTERTAEAARRMAEAEKQLREASRDIRVPAEEMRALGEKARAMAERVRPTTEELAEIRRLSAEAARRGAEQARDAMRMAEEALREAREALKKATEEQAKEEPRP